MLYKVITIAGSDSSGGAGIQADLKTILALGGYGMSVVTAVTAQNTLGINGILPVDNEMVALQLESLLNDIGADCIKTGMLVNGDVVHIVADRIRRYGIEKLVVDPVMYSKTRTCLLDEDGRRVLRTELFPITYLLTPNIPEAEELTGREIRNVDDMVKAAKRLQKMGPKFVLVKGGHLPDSPVDVLHDGSQHYEFGTQKVSTAHSHGTGCTLASAISVLIGQTSASYGMH